MRRSWSLVCAAAALLLCSCERRVSVSKEMLWECDGAAVEMVTFRYPEAPGDYISVSERGVCDQLRGSGQKTATVVSRFGAGQVGCGGIASRRSTGPRSGAASRAS